MWSSVCPVDLSYDFLVPIHCVSSHSKDSLSVVVFCYMLMCVGCFGLVVSTCQVIGWKDPSEDTLTWWGDYLHKAQVELEESVCVYFSFVWFVYVPMCPPCPTQYIFQTPMTRYSLFVLKVSLNSNQPTSMQQWLLAYRAWVVGAIVEEYIYDDSVYVDLGIHTFLHSGEREAV